MYSRLSPLLKYLKNKYLVKKAFYFGGVEIHNFPHNYLDDDSVPLDKLKKYLQQIIKNKARNLNEAELALLGRHLQRVKFYQKLEQFGYELILKPVKLYRDRENGTRRKANVDVEITFRLIRDKDDFSALVFLSGDGDFLPVLKYLQKNGKTIFIVARGPRTAKEIRQFAGANFRDFEYLREILRVKNLQNK